MYMQSQLNMQFDIEKAILLFLPPTEYADIIHIAIPLSNKGCIMSHSSDVLNRSARAENHGITCAPVIMHIYLYSQ